jgi:hypothetical protein
MGILNRLKSLLRGGSRVAFLRTSDKASLLMFVRNTLVQKKCTLFIVDPVCLAADPILWTNAVKPEALPRGIRVYVLPVEEGSRYIVYIAEKTVVEKVYGLDKRPQAPEVPDIVVTHSPRIAEESISCSQSWFYVKGDTLGVANTLLDIVIAAMAGKDVLEEIKKKVEKTTATATEKNEKNMA